MESSWRLNMATYGLGPGAIYLPLSLLGFFTICSRIRSGPHTGQILTNNTAPSGVMTVVLPTNPLLPYTAGRIPGGFLIPHFPYGYDVDPDTHP